LEWPQTLKAPSWRVRELAESIPGEYFIFSLATGRRLDLKMTDASNGPPSSSVVRAKAAMRGHFKTGHMKWPGT
jgi:hypothetical protein